MKLLESCFLRRHDTTKESSRIIDRIRGSIRYFLKGCYLLRKAQYLVVQRFSLNLARNFAKSTGCKGWRAQPTLGPKYASVTPMNLLELFLCALFFLCLLHPRLCKCEIDNFQRTCDDVPVTKIE